LQTGVCASPAAHFLCLIACIRRDIIAAWFCSCSWRSDECILFLCFNAQPGIFAVMNCCVAALRIFSSDILTWSADSAVTHKIRGMRVLEERAYYVNKLRQNVGLENEYNFKLWRHKQRTPKTNDHHKPLNEHPPHEHFLRTPLMDLTSCG